MGIFDLFRKKQTNSFGEDLTHLTADGELPWGWISANRNFTDKIEAEYRYFADRFYEEKKKGISAEYSALKSLVLYMEDAKKLCASKGECFAKWAEISVAHPETLADYKQRIAYIEENIDSLFRTEKALKKLNAEIVEIIRSEPGVIQSDIYKRFDPSMKNHISNELYQMEAHNVIIREKSGRSYKLYIK